MWVMVVLMSIMFSASFAFAKGNRGGEDDDGVLEFVIVPKGLHPWYDPSAEGFADAAAEIGGINTRYTGPVEFTGEAQGKMIEDLIAEGVDGLAIAVVDEGALTPIINEAVRRGITVVTFDDTARDSDSIIFIGTDNYTAGVIEGHAIADMTDGKGNFIIFVQDLSSANIKNRTRGIRDALSEYSGMNELADVQVAGYNPSEGISIAENLYQAYPELTITAEAGMNGAIGMYMMMKEKGMAPNSIINVAWTTLPEVIDGMKAGYIHGTVRQNPYAMGYLSTYALKWAIDGKRPKENYFDSGVVFATADEVDTVDEVNKQKVPEMFKEFKALWD